MCVCHTTRHVTDLFSYMTRCVYIYKCAQILVMTSVMHITAPHGTPRFNGPQLLIV